MTKMGMLVGMGKCVRALIMLESTFTTKAPQHDRKSLQNEKSSNGTFFGFEYQCPCGLNGVQQARRVQSWIGTGTHRT